MQSDKKWQKEIDKKKYQQKVTTKRWQKDVIFEETNVKIDYLKVMEMHVYKFQVTKIWYWVITVSRVLNLNHNNGQIQSDKMKKWQTESDIHKSDNKKKWQKRNFTKKWQKYVNFQVTNVKNRLFNSHRKSGKVREIMRKFQSNKNLSLSNYINLNHNNGLNAKWQT